jgi:hypothetical protein
MNPTQPWQRAIHPKGVNLTPFFSSQEGAHGDPSPCRPMVGLSLASCRLCGGLQKGLCCSSKPSFKRILFPAPFGGYLQTYNLEVFTASSTSSDLLRLSSPRDKMGKIGRFACILTPMLCTLASLVCVILILTAGTTRHMLPSVYYIQVLPLPPPEEAPSSS